MIPLKITIEGLYSYQERQVVDFTELTDAGLFGIFGATGSGKSSILEAISYALYGETERLHARDKRTYNMMNLKSNRSYLEFEFVNFENKHYKVVREFKRNTKNFEDVKSPTVQYYYRKNDHWIPMENADTEKIVGLSYVNFKRTIIIPQGQFKEFLELGPTERNEMMMEVFNLKKFDLQDKVSKLQGANNSKLDELKGKLSGYEEVSNEKIKEIEEQFSLVKNDHQTAHKKFQEFNEKFQKIKSLKREAVALEKNRNEFKILDNKRLEIEAQLKKVEQFEKVEKLFSPLLQRKKEYRQELDNVSTKLSKAENELKKIREAIAQNLLTMQELKPLFDTLDIEKQKLSEFEIILKLKTLNVEIKRAGERANKGREVVANTKNKITEYEKQIKILGAEADNLKKKKLDSNLLLGLSNWYQHHQHLKERLATIGKAINDIQEKIKIADKKLQSFGAAVDSYEKDFEQQEHELIKQKELLEIRRNHLKLEEKLSEYAHELHDGKPCPLCGSEDHPKIIEIKYVSHELRSIQSKIQKVEKLIKELNEKRNIIKEILIAQKGLAEQLKERKNEYELSNEESRVHKKKFIWQDFDADCMDTFNKAKKDSADAEGEISQKEKFIKNIQEQLEKDRVNLEKYTLELNKIEDEEKVNRAELKAQMGNLKVLRYDDYTELENNSVNEEQKELEQKILKIESAYKNADKDKAEFEKQNSATTAKISEIRTQSEDCNNKLKAVEFEISDALKKSVFGSEETIVEILNRKLNVEEERKQIDSFNKQFEKLKNEIERQENILKNFVVEDEIFEQKEKELAEAERALEALTRKMNQTESELIRLRKDFQEKKELLVLQSQLQERQENFKTIFGLMKGKGFVQYVSSIYLHQLCDNANIRFHRMTRNQLSLTINESGNFEVIDFLNEGRSRSVKTLSGGQAFQVSLSLALALAESVQANNQSQQNFFFIDEGFGTQDSESVNVVFDTLMQLQKENRIVGIISHVEELKERMPRALQITKDTFKGSVIELV